MKKLVCSYLIVLILLMPAVTVLSTGCSCLRQACQPYGPRVAGDSAGGAIAVYEDIESDNQHDFYVQKISSAGEALWGEAGVLIGSAYKQCDSFHELYIVSDGSGGALVTWSGYPSEPDWKQAPGRRHVEYLTHVTKVDSAGNIGWQREVRGVKHMLEDGAGGVIIAGDYGYDDRTISVVKIDSAGNFSWGEDGVLIVSDNIYQSNSLGLANDGSGGAIVIWEELQTEPGPEPHRPKTTNHIYVQRINAEGSLPWGQDRVLLYTTPDEVYSEGPKLISDGSGGAIAIWMQVPEGKVEGGTPKALTMDLYVQRVDASGNILWQPNGVPLEISKSAEMAFPHSPAPVSDGSAGAIIAWADMRKGLISMYAQKVGADGSMNWQPGGAEISSSSPNNVISDGSGGIIVTFGYKEGESTGSRLCVQRIDAAGSSVWPGAGTPVTEHGTHDITCDGHGGAVIAWGSGKLMFSSEKSYVQKVNAEGKLLWGDKGIRLNP